MIGFVLALAAVLLGSTATGRAQHGERNSSPCQPQPECRVITTPLRPGAPTTGMNPQGKQAPEQVIIFNNQSTNSIKRDTFRLPVQ